MPGTPSTDVYLSNVFLGQGQLMHIHKTLDSIQRRSAQRSRLEQQQMHAADKDTISLRAKVNARCEPHAHVGHMLCIAVHINPDTTVESPTVVYCVFGQQYTQYIVYDQSELEFV